MSKTKPVNVNDRTVWMDDNSHDIVVAHLVEAADAAGLGELEAVTNWRVWASVGDYGFRYPFVDSPVPEIMKALLTDVRARIVDHGDVERGDLASWSVFDGVSVSDGFVRRDRISIDDLLGVVDALVALLIDTFPEDPPDAAWCIGFGPEPTTIAMRTP